MSMMFVLVSRYQLPPDQVSALIPVHSEWIARHYASKRILVSGRREPTVGGVIVAYGENLAEIQEWIADDPFRHQWRRRIRDRAVYRD